MGFEYVKLSPKYAHWSQPPHFGIGGPVYSTAVIKCQGFHASLFATLSAYS